jgi:SH3 domain-containing YSC84-like protein 1
MSLAAEEPVWQKDSDWTNCRECSVLFDNFMNRKHHCRYCGYIFCGKCTKGRSLLPVTFGIHDPQRVCTHCHIDLEPHQQSLSDQNANAERLNQVDLTDGSYKRYLNMPYSSTLGSEIRKSAYSLHNLFSSDWLEDKSIPKTLLKDCAGIAFMTVVKAGFLFAGKVGTGLVIGRRPDGTWSAPSAIATMGVSWGLLIGADVTDFVVILRTSNALKAFSGVGNIQLGAGVDVALGPIGRAANGTIAVGDKGLAPVLSYSQSRGLFAGLSLDGTIIGTRKGVNFKFYGKHYDPIEILTGDTVPQPKAAAPLYEAIMKHMDGTLDDNEDGGYGGEGDAHNGTNPYGTPSVPSSMRSSVPTAAPPAPPAASAWGQPGGSNPPSNIAPPAPVQDNNPWGQPGGSQPTSAEQNISV